MEPQSLTNVFTYKGNMTNYNPRNISSILCLPQPRTNYLKKSFMYDGQFLWNSIPKDIKENLFLPFVKKSLLTLMVKRNM